MALFIGIDLGTSGCRAIAIDEDGNIRGNAITTLPDPVRHNQNVEQDPDLWWQAVCACLSELTTIVNTDEIRAIAVDGTSATLLLADDQDAALCPALMYNDSRATEQARSIAAVAPPDTAAQGASSALAKLLWLFEQGSREEKLSKENVTRRVRYAMHQADWINAKLCNQSGVSDFNNALKMGFDAQQNTWPTWITRLLENTGVPTSVLPRVVRPGSPIGYLSPENAKRFKLPETTRIVAGTTDSTASFLATGANRIGDAVTSLGSTLVLKVISDTPVFAPEFGVYSQPLVALSATNQGQRWLVGGASNSGGSVLRQFFSLQQLEAMTPRLSPQTPTGLAYYPLPATGERFPVNDASLEPQLEPRPDDDVTFFQAIIEGIARIEARGYALLAELGAPYPATVRSTGGGAANPAWTAIRQDMLSGFNNSHTRLISAAQTEAAYGSACLARMGAYTTIEREE